MPLLRVRVLTLAVGALALLGAGRSARAHQMTTTFGEIAEDGPTLRWRLRVRATDLVTALGASPEGAAPAWRARALNYLRAGVGVSTDHGACDQTRADLARDPSEAEATLVLTAVFSCPAGDSRFHVHYGLFFEGDRFHQAFTRLGPGFASADGASSLVFRDSARESVLVSSSSVSPPGSLARDVAAYLKLGVIHILTGYDHLCFLMALLLAAGLSRRTRRGGESTAEAAPPRQAVMRTIKLVSAFTIAHSLTLISQAFHPGLVSARWVEPAIAFSVAYVGFENLLPRLPRFRYLVVFGFGLIHGLGFASVLHEIGLPKRGFLLSLVAFNVGVELGQLSVLTLAFPIVHVAARRNPRNYERWGLCLGSAVITLLGTVWLIARLRVL